MNEKKDGDLSGNRREKETVRNPAQSKLPSLMAKAGNTDLRRDAKELGRIVQNKGMDPHGGDLYFFSNMKKSVKMLLMTEDGVLLVTKKYNVPIEGWPEYQPNAGNFVKFKGKSGGQFLDKMGLPKNL
jgi:hypothetical protein